MEGVRCTLKAHMLCLFVCFTLFPPQGLVEVSLSPWLHCKDWKFLAEEKDLLISLQWWERNFCPDWGSLKNWTQKRVQILRLSALQPQTHRSYKKARTRSYPLRATSTYRKSRVEARGGACLHSVCGACVCAFPSSTWTRTNTAKQTCQGSECKMARIIYKLLQSKERL